MLPLPDQLGDSLTWEIPNEGATVKIKARFIGMGSSRSAYHKGHPPNTFAEQGVKCQGCRWMEIRIFDDGDTFTVSYMGASAVPGETDRTWYVTTDSEDGLVDLLSGDGHSGRFFSKPARLAIESARQFVPEIGDAYTEHPGHPVRAR